METKFKLTDRDYVRISTDSTAPGYVGFRIHLGECAAPVTVDPDHPASDPLPVLQQRDVEFCLRVPVARALGYSLTGAAEEAKSR